MNISSRIKIISAGVVVVRYKNDTPLFLITRAYNIWGFAKGKVEKNETLLEAALRETYEETRMAEKDLDFVWGHQSVQTPPYKRGRKLVVYFIAKTDKKEVELPYVEEIGRAENDEYRWATYEEAKELMSGRGELVLDWAKAVIGN